MSDRKRVWVSRSLVIEATEEAAWEIAMMLPNRDGFTDDLISAIRKTWPYDETAP